MRFWRDELLTNVHVKLVRRRAFIPHQVELRIERCPPAPARIEAGVAIKTIDTTTIQPCKATVTRIERESSRLKIRAVCFRPRNIKLISMGRHDRIDGVLNREVKT